MTGDTQIELDRWPTNRTAYLTLDLEEDYAGLLPEQSFDAATRVDDLVDLLETYDVPLSCFLQTQLLEEEPEVVRTLERASVPVEFHAHTHTHPLRDAADVEFEVEESVTRVRDRFGTEPLGFRFPEGVTMEGDYGVLARQDVAFDSSLFPSWRPGRFDNTDAPTTPYRHCPTGVVELPFAVLSNRIRVPVALSYFKLLGRPFQWFAQRTPPRTVVFDMHMHDLVTPPAFERLPAHYRLIYGRRKHQGLDALASFVEALDGRGYEFGSMTDLYENVEAQFDESTVPASDEHPPASGRRHRITK